MDPAQNYFYPCLRTNQSKPIRLITYMTRSSPVELAKPKAKRRRKAIISSRKQIRASRMRQEKQEYDSLNSTVKALEFFPDRTRSSSRIRRSQIRVLKTLLGRELEWGRPEKWSSLKHMIYREFPRPRYEPIVDVYINPLEN